MNGTSSIRLVCSALTRCRTMKCPGHTNLQPLRSLWLLDLQGHRQLHRLTALSAAPCTTSHCRRWMQPVASHQCAHQASERQQCCRLPCTWSASHCALHVPGSLRITRLVTQVDAALNIGVPALPHTNWHKHKCSIPQCPAAPLATHRHWPRPRALPFTSLSLMPLHTLSAPGARSITCTASEISTNAAARWLTCTKAASNGSSANVSLQADDTCGQADLHLTSTVHTLG